MAESREQIQLMSVTSIDGRYGEKTTELQEITSEHALMRYRAIVEVKWLQHILSGNVSDLIPPVSDEALATLDQAIDSFSIDDSLAIKDFETTTKHDVKAVEYWLRSKMTHPELTSRKELAHFGATSEDINNLAYAMMTRDLIEQVFLPRLRGVRDDLARRAIEWSDIPTLGLTHGQPATPTTLGKMVAVPAHRLHRQIGRIESTNIYGKFNGATGNMNAVMVADPDVDWQKVNHDFVSSLGFTPNEITTQIESLDWFYDFANDMAHANEIIKGFDVDTWLNIMLKRFSQTPEKGATGSSTMPQKINPINFENSEGSLHMASVLWQGMANRLSYSRLERDLSGSTVMRNIGYVAGLEIVGLDSISRAIKSINPNSDHIEQELAASPEVLAEALQTVMRIYSQREDAPESYAVLKELTRGKSFTIEDYVKFVDELDLPSDVKDRLRDMVAANYTGKAAELARQVGDEIATKNSD